MTPYDLAALENAEFQACIDLYRVAPEPVRKAHAIEMRVIGAATWLERRGFARG
jgi:hypothetical protein